MAKTKEALSETREEVNNCDERSEEEFAVSIESAASQSFSSKTILFATSAIFAALGPALSITFIWFPYFELMTLTLFIAGMTLGFGFGTITATLAATIYEILATVIIGPALAIFPFKLVAYVLIALSGALVRLIIPERASIAWRIIIATAGLLLTVCYDLLANLGIVFFMDLELTGYFAMLITGLPTSIFRVITNTTMFFFVLDIFNRGIKPIFQKYQPLNRLKETNKKPKK